MKRQVNVMDTNKFLQKAVIVFCRVCVKYVFLPISMKLTEIEVDLSMDMGEMLD